MRVGRASQPQVSPLVSGARQGSAHIRKAPLQHSTAGAARLSDIEAAYDHRVGDGANQAMQDHQRLVGAVAHGPQDRHEGTARDQDLAEGAHGER